MRTLIRSGMVVTADDTVRAGALVEDEPQRGRGRGLDVAADEVIDATGRSLIGDGQSTQPAGP